VWKFNLFSSEFFLEIGKTFPITGGLGETLVVNPFKIKSVAAKFFGQFDGFPENEVSCEKFSPLGRVGGVVVVGDIIVD